MDEARRFLRYVTPGVLYAIETALLLWLLLPEWTAERATDLLRVASWATVLGGLFAGGGIGYFFSVIHHSVHWLGTRGVIDHRDAVARLAEEEIVQLYEANSTVPIPKDSVRKRLSRRDAWILTPALWHQRIKCSRQIEGADSKTVALTDHVHAAGAARVAAVFSLATVFVVASQVSQPTWGLEPVPRFLATIVTGLLVFAVFQRSHEVTGDLAQGVIDEVLIDALKAEGERNATPEAHSRCT